MFQFLRNLFGGSPTLTPDQLTAMAARRDFTPGEVRAAIEIAPSIDQSQFELAVVDMAKQGVAPELSMRILNMLPIVAGRVMMREMELNPQFPDHYIIRGNDGEVEVSFADCPVCNLISEAITKNPQLSMIGMGSCEMLAFNDALHHLGDDPTPERMAEVKLLPPELGGDPITVASENAS